MSEIDVQNAKQIRDPMDVLIKMEVPEDVSVAYSGYSSSTKVSDAVLDERSWPMRVLADLQGDGFPLNGSCQLYDPTVEASASNGKIGIRGNVGEDLSITITGDGTINGMSIMASGTNTVRFNGQTATIVGGQVIIPVGSDSITIEFIPQDVGIRAEVSFAVPGTSIQVTNELLISCVVSLRSDLSIEEPTLPESELNFEIYNDVDISEVVATIPDDTPITYSAGYQDDMSETRNFYLAGQITWTDNILSVHAVDAVHFLEFEPEPLFLTQNLSATNDNFYVTPREFVAAIKNLFLQVGFNLEIKTPCYRKLTNIDVVEDKPSMLIPRMKMRDLIAFVNNLFKIDGLPEDFLSNYKTYPGIDSFWLTFVDAGIPSFKTIKPDVKWDIYEDDIGDAFRTVDRKITKINVQHKAARLKNNGKDPIGSIDWEKNGPAYVELPSEPTVNISYVLPKSDAFKTIYPSWYGKLTSFPILPTSVAGGRFSNAEKYSETIDIIPGDISITSYTTGGTVCFDNKTKQDTKKQNGIYTQVVPTKAKYVNEGSFVWPWTSLNKAWSKLVSTGVFESSATEENIEIRGVTIYTYDSSFNGCQSVENGTEIDMECPISGYLLFPTTILWPTQPVLEGFPKMAYESILKRSNVTGSFTWKGDPRMQPRDVVNFHRLDGSVETITLENITLHHEGGGTYAEITYRKGVC